MGVHWSACEVVEVLKDTKGQRSITNTCSSSSHVAEVLQYKNVAIVLEGHATSGASPLLFLPVFL